MCSLKQPTLITNLCTLQTDYFGDYTRHTNFPGLSTERRHAFVAVALQLKHWRRMLSLSFIFASSVKMTWWAVDPAEGVSVVSLGLVANDGDSAEGRSNVWFEARVSHPRADGMNPRPWLQSPWPAKSPPFVCGRCSGCANLAVEVSRTDPVSEGMCHGEICMGDWNDTGSDKRDVDRASSSNAWLSASAYLITRKD